MRQSREVLLLPAPCGNPCHPVDSPRDANTHTTPGSRVARII